MILKQFIAIALGLTWALASQSARAQSDPRYIQFSPRETKGALYTPDAGDPSPIAFLVTHRTSNFLSHVATEELAKRGYMVLGMNPRSDNNEAAVDWDTMALDVRQGVRFLREQPGIEKVVLIAHSGGGPTMSFYQAVAENGPSYCQGDNKVLPCSAETLSGFEHSDKADGIVFLDAHPGNSVNAIRSINPAVTDEENWKELDPSLDPFSEANGYNPDGLSEYSDEFVQRYTQAQAARLNRLIDQALAIKAGLDEGDDAPFIFYRNDARLSDISHSVHGGTLEPQKLLKNDGSISTEVIKTVRAPVSSRKVDDASFEGARFLTVNSFLGANAIRGTDSLDGVEWCSSNNSTVCAVQSISVPVLVAAAQGHYFIRDGEQIYELAASKDKDFITVEGMSHSLAECQKCTEMTGESYDNARKNLFDYIAKWTEEKVSEGN